ncbi:MAG: DUF1015 domain-containing protein [Acidimicrobiia bacterium]|nr:DUF1015 domain-containing protein [Acidimicrobiia bacterium]
MFSPFTGLLFDPDVVSSVGDASSPPYDVIDEDGRQALLASSPYNVVRLLLADADDPSYAEAARLLREWRSEGVLVPDPQPRLYLYSMQYEYHGEAREARGVLGSLEVTDLGERVVPHEETMAKHRADRYSVLTATQTNVDPIIALSSAPELAALLGHDGPWRLDFTTTDGVRHRLHDISDPDEIAAITAAVRAHPVAIADGHHRYTTALQYRRDREAEGHAPQGWDGIMTLVAPAQGSGLTCGPYHRIFDSFPFSADRIADAFTIAPAAREAPQVPGELVVVTQDGAWRLTATDGFLATLPEPWREASPAVARELLYPRLGVTEDHAAYVPEATDAMAAVPPGGGALLVAPVSEHAMAVAGETALRFPQKSTFFVPKPRAGLVMRPFDLSTEY